MLHACKQRCTHTLLAAPPLGIRGPAPLMSSRNASLKSPDTNSGYCGAAPACQQTMSHFPVNRRASSNCRCIFGSLYRFLARAGTVHAGRMGMPKEGMCTSPRCKHAVRERHVSRTVCSWHAAQKQLPHLLGGKHVANMHCNDGTHTELCAHGMPRRSSPPPPRRRRRSGRSSCRPSSASGRRPARRRQNWAARQPL